MELTSPRRSDAQSAMAVFGSQTGTSSVMRMLHPPSLKLRRDRKVRTAVAGLPNCLIFGSLATTNRTNRSRTDTVVSLHGIIESYHWKFESGQNSAKSLRMRYLRIANLQGHLRNI